ncbi:MAG: hypothetical protein GXO83_11690, partial [Chlorobi bacterium]|nr:hypothetical protein [Chlorobiota bacterium]
MWLKADSIQGLINNDPVDTWRDISGNSNNVTQATVNNQPTFLTNYLNGFPVVSFNPVNNEYLSGNFGSGLSAPFTIITVVRFDNTSQYSYVINIGDGGADANVSVSRDYTAPYNSYYCWAGGGEYYDAPKDSLQAGDLKIINAVHTAAGNHNLYFNGINQTVTPTGSPGILNPTGTLNIGRRWNGSSGSNYMEGYTPEIIIYNRELNSTEQIIVENYLSAKYGISIAASGNDYYNYDATHYFDVAGIGRKSLTSEHTVAMSSGILQIGPATALDDGEFLLFGHQNGLLSSWTSSGTPADTIQIIPRNWRLDETGNVGNVTILADYNFLPPAPASCSNHYILVDGDGDFSAGATIYELSLVSGSQYDVSNVVINNGDYITIGIGSMPVADAGSGGNECDLDFVLGATPSVGTGTWTKQSGPGTASFAPDANTSNATVTVTTYGTYVFRWTEVSGSCSDFDEITVNFYEQPVANAGSGGDECDLDFVLGATPSVGTGTWTKQSGPGTTLFTPDANTPNATVTVSAYGTYVFRWTEVNGSCSDFAEVTVSFAETADAGPNQDLCGTLAANLAGNTPSAGTGTWTKVSGPGTVVFSNPNLATSTATVSLYGIYVFRWTIDNNGSCSTFSDVTIDFNEDPTGLSAGADQDLCGTLTTSLTGTAHTYQVGSDHTGSTGVWTQVSGVGTITFTDNTDPTTSITTDLYGSYTLRWTETNGTCTQFDDVVIDFNEDPTGLSAGADQDLCGVLTTNLTGTAHTYQVGSDHTGSTGVWTQVSGVGTITFTDNTDPTTFITADLYGSYTLRWTETNGTCTQFDEVVIDFNEDPTGLSAGADQDLCGVLTTNLTGTAHT